MSEPLRDAVIRPGKRRQKVSLSPHHVESAYPVADYRVLASDALGRSAKVSITCPPDFKRIASVILAQRLFSFGNEQDIYRWCLHHGLKELDRRAKDEAVTSATSAMNAWMAAASKEDEMVYYNGVMQKISKTVDNLISLGHWSQALKIAEEVWRTIDRIDDPHWRDVFRSWAKRTVDKVARIEKRKMAR